ncbi:preprotein translocase subunit SecA [Kribbella speibonae]|uniref:Protein translocase subunit SecA n=1 Tax=Kribbella speibonae TaxID=1572660 RepID=A0A4R0ITC2_9ACTN|nr:preprotein translocase subunit SecA [Kribbella speibonae]TCC27411.1 preprotein translocase subunit SecA [Kribbella speibonae]TCC35724.1 preprotein translocase subunit SecA [Kribbella speibonae]
MKVVDKVLRIGEGKILRQLQGIAKMVNSIEDDFVNMSDEELRAQTAEFKERHENGESLDALLPEAFAVVREAAKRTLHQRHYDVQIMGGAALHLGNIAEMKTGEGKTLVGTLPTYLNALSGKGVHVVTVNDYLAKYQAEWMGRVYHFLGLDYGVILPEMTPAERRIAYAKDITYGTNNEFGFDYLRDNMAGSIEDCVQREHNYAIVDEVDSILVDEARTPLIISGPAEDSQRWYVEMARIANTLKAWTLADEAELKRKNPRVTDLEIDETKRRVADYDVDEKKRTVAILERGIEKVEDRLGIDNLYESANTPLISYLNNALKAKDLFHRDKDYVVVDDGEVLIVDEHTGRTLHGRRYNEGLHQAIEAKEGVEIKEEYQTLATITLQNYFRLYSKLAGMTGTAMTEANEFSKVYKLGVVPIPTNKPMIRVEERDLIFRTEDAKFDAVVKDIVDAHSTGQPILVGTTSVEKSERLSRQLLKENIKHEVLNAKQHAREAAIVAEAGRKGAVTVATNMAGRGTDIILGGNPEFLADKELRARGIDPAEDIEQYEAEYPEMLEQFEKQVKEEQEEVRELGGLYVLGTERHESRRIDNQLRGRAGRQGDPGKSRFYLSLEDDLMRLFKREMVDWAMSRNNDDSQPLENKVVTKAIASAQGQVEAQNFETRKNILKYDDVMNRQRHVVYDERRRVLEGADLRDQVSDMLEETVTGYVQGATADGFAEDWDLDALFTAMKTLYQSELTEEELIEEAGGEKAGLTQDFLVERFLEDATAAYERREELLGEEAMRELERRVVLSVLDRKWREHLYEMDYLREGIGLRAMAQRDPLVEYQREGYDMFASMMESIKEESVGFIFNVEVDIEAMRAEMELANEAALADEDNLQGRRIQDILASGPAAAELVDGDEERPQDTPRPRDTPRLRAKGLTNEPRPQRLTYSAPTIDGDDEVAMHQDAVEEGTLQYAGTPRNAACPCGSGKKYKRCHGDPQSDVYKF